MSDIAMLVAEEYERRIKNSRKAGSDASEDGKIDMVKWVSIGVSIVSQNVENAIRQENFDQVIAKLVALEPKSQIGLAACNGFFSA